jgi:hypothetical protein
MGEASPTQLTGPHPAVGAQREPAALERGDHLVGGPGGAEHGEHVAHCCLHLGVRVDDRGALVVVDEPDR